MDLFSEKVGHVWVSFPVNSSHLRAVNPGVHHEVVGNERSLGLVNFLTLLLLVKLQGLGLMVMPQVGAVENPDVRQFIGCGQIIIQLVFSNNNLEN